MIMSVHDPLSRKRPIENQDQVSNKRMKEEEFDEGNKHIFSEKMYSVYVKAALESLDNNDPLQIDTLTTKISLPRTNNESIQIINFCTVLKILISNISKLDNQYCNKLIVAIVDYSWLEIEDKDFQELYSQFLLVLISSLPKYLFQVTSKIVSELSSVKSSSSQSSTPLALSINHKILNRVFKFNPTFINNLPSIFQKNFPHHLAGSSDSLTNYIDNLLKILSYCPELQYDIWQLIIECCIKLDVELQNDLDDLDDDEVEELINGQEEEEEEEGGEGEENDSDSDDSEDDDDDDDDIDSDIDDKDEGSAKLKDQVPEEPKNESEKEDNDGEEEYLINPITSTQNIKELVNKLDSIIALLMRSTQGSFSEEEINNGNGVCLYNTITSLFKTHVLPTHFTKLIQFILFHISQLQLELSDSFLVLLIDISFNINEILEKRLKALQYLSSYIARAKNLTDNQITFVVSYLIGWLNKYIDEREWEINNNSDNKGGMERFKLFYSTFQTLLYIFCFRYKILLNEEENKWECDIDKFFQRVIITKFNPLKFIDETVCFQFAKIATKLNVCYCYSIIEHNKRERMLNSNSTKDLPLSVGNFRQKQEFLDLEAYFPFDPLVLPQSKSIIGLQYIEWSDVNPNDDDEDDDSGTSSGRSTYTDSDNKSNNDSDSDITSDDE